jgi:hypothetical protein
LTIAACTTALAGCACVRPIVAGPLYLGIGAFCDHRLNTPQPDDASAQVRYIDLEGVGLLIAFNGIRLGYSRLNAVVADPQADFDLNLTRMRVATGSHALCAAAGFTPSLAPKPEETCPD